jgi:hypothetical protein
MSTRSRRLLSETEQTGPRDDGEECLPATRVSPEGSSEDQEEYREEAGENDLSPQIVRRLSRQFGIPETELMKAAGTNQSESLTERLTMEREAEGEKYWDPEGIIEEGSDDGTRRPESQNQGTGRLEEMERLLEDIDQYFDQETGAGDLVSALEILMSRVLVNVAQPDLGKVKGGIRVRSMDQLVEEVTRIMGDDVEKIKKSAVRGGKDLIRDVREFNRKVAAAMMIRPMLVTATTLRLWMESGDKRVRQMCMDSCQAMCRTEPSEWKALGKELAGGTMDEELLTDESVEGLPGFLSLAPAGKEYQSSLDSAWTKLMLFSSMYLAYEPEAPISEEEALGKWSVSLGGPQHHLNMRKGEKVIWRDVERRRCAPPRQRE